MQITETMMEYCESQNWDEDVRQDVYIKIMEMEDPEEFHNGMLGTMYRNAYRDRAKKEARRRELEQEAVTTLEGLHGKDDVHNPLDYLEAEALVEQAGCLSPLLYNTLRDFVLGKTPEEIAKNQGVSANTVYQRLWQAKKEITDG